MIDFLSSYRYPLDKVGSVLLNRAMHDTGNWICDCEEMFLYPMSTTHCDGCGVLSPKVKDKLRVDNIDELPFSKWYNKWA